MHELKSILQREIDDYERGETIGGTTYVASDPEKERYLVYVVTGQTGRPPRAVVVIAARIVDGQIIIDEDISDRPLVNELIRAGIPRSQITLAYAGELQPA